jgi:hypothetical protein
MRLRNTSTSHTEQCAAWRCTSVHAAEQPQGAAGGDGCWGGVGCCRSHVGWMGLGGSASMTSWMSRTQGSSPTNCRACRLRYMM